MMAKPVEGTHFCKAKGLPEKKRGISPSCSILMSKCMISLIILWFMPISPVLSNEMTHAVPLSDSVVFFKVPFVATCGDRVLYFDFSDDESYHLTVFGLSDGQKLAAFTIGRGQGPCEGIDLSPIGCRNGDWLIVKFGGQKQLIRFDQNGHCQGVENFPLIDGKLSEYVVFADMFSRNFC